MVAALIITSLIFGLTTVVNSARSGDNNQGFYDLSHEINFETKRVLDYGTYYKQDTDKLVQTFLVNYADYVSQQKVLFVFGDDKGNLKAMYFIKEPNGMIGIGTGGLSSNIVIQHVKGATANVKAASADGVTTGVDAVIQGVNYHFDLLPGQNFFFVMIKEDNNEAFVATNQ